MSEILLSSISKNSVQSYTARQGHVAPELALYGDNAYYQAYPRFGTSGMFAYAGTSALEMVYFPDDIQIRSFIIQAISGTSSILQYGLFEINPTGFLKSGNKVFEGVVLENTLVKDVNAEIILATPVSIKAGFYMFGLSGQGSYTPRILIGDSRSYRNSALQRWAPKLADEALNFTDNYHYIVQSEINSMTVGMPFQHGAGCFALAFGFEGSGS